MNKTYWINLLLFFLINFVSGQNDEEIYLDVAGRTHISGPLELHNFGDSSSLYIGYQTGLQVTGPQNTFVGSRAGGIRNPPTGANSFFGYESGFEIRSGGSNSCFGVASCHDLANGLNNSAFGHAAGYKNWQGNYNAYFGSSAGFTNYSGNMNSFFGRNAGFKNYSGNNNTYVGYEAGRNNLRSFNVMIGDSSGWNLLGSGNVLIGHNAGPSTNAYSPAGDNKLYIHNAKSSDPLIYGEFDNNFLRINGTHEIKASGFQLLMDNPNAGGATWRVGSSSSDWNIGGGKLVIGTSTTSANGHLFITNLGSVGIGVSSPTGELDIDGDIRIRNLSGSGSMDIAVNDFGKIVFSASDKRLKKNIQTLEGSLLKVNQLRGVSYEWIEGPNPTKTYGLVAQEVLQAVPEIVTQHEGYYGVNYSELSALLIEAIKEQQTIIENLKSQTEKQDNQLLSLLMRIEDLETNGRSTNEDSSR